MSGIIKALINGEDINPSQLPQIENPNNLRHYLTDIKTTALISGKTITYPEYLNGGGSIHKKYFLESIGDKKYKNAFEWCAGHGEIGFELITNGICETLTFSDCYNKSAEWCLKNAQDLGIADHVTAVTSSIIGNLSFKHKFDLVVGNPPNSAGLNMAHIQTYLTDENEDHFIHWHRINNDLNFAAHREFFDSLYKYITGDADIFLSVNFRNETHFRSIATASGFKLVRIIDMLPDDPHLKIFHFQPW